MILWDNFRIRWTIFNTNRVHQFHRQKSGGTQSMWEKIKLLHGVYLRLIWSRLLRIRHASRVICISPLRTPQVQLNVRPVKVRPNCTVSAQRSDIFRENKVNEKKMLRKRTSTNGNVGQAEAIHRLHQLHRHVQKRQMLKSVFIEIKKEFRRHDRVPHFPPTSIHLRHCWTRI